MQVQSKSNVLSVQNQAQDDWKIIHAIHKKWSENFIQKKTVLSKLFHFICPFLNEVDNKEVLVSNQCNLENENFIPSHLEVKESNFIPLFDNYYQTDSITKSSITMAKSSSSFQNQKWPF
jgi:NADH dehydrogenase/NADH:ubiquinone oxidoreductase subunit G